jgi:hypothetical protein
MYTGKESSCSEEGLKEKSDVRFAQYVFEFTVEFVGVFYSFHGVSHSWRARLEVYGGNSKRMALDL